MTHWYLNALGDLLLLGVLLLRYRTPGSRQGHTP
jgi:hypothetical protein